MNKLLEKLKNNWMYIVAFLIPWIVVLIKGFVTKTWPVGNYTLIGGDTREQLVPFAFELWDKIHTGSSLKYTWNLGGGCDFGTILGYYTSPFTILLLLSTRNHIVDMVQLIMILKWSCAGVTMVYFFYHTKYNTLEECKKLVSLFLGMAFILSNSQINFVRYMQFTDVTICFPILLLLVERMVDNKRWILYCFILAFCMYSNLYYSFQLCVFLVVWFVFQLDSRVEDKLKKFLIFAGSSTLSAIMSGISIVNTFYLASSRIDNTGNDARVEYIYGWHMNISKFIKQFFILSKIDIPQEITPNNYCSILVLVLLGFVIFIKIERRTKICLIIGIAFMIISYFNGFLNLAWHLLTPPNAVYHRFSNYFIFVILFAVLLVLIHLKDIRIYQVIVIGLLLLAGCLYTFFNVDYYEDYLVYLLTVMLLVLYVMLMIFCCKKSIIYKNMLIIVVILGMVELGGNAYYQFLDQYNSLDYSDKGRAIDYIGLADKVNLDDGERFSITTGLTNIGLITSEPCISGFISSINGKMLTLLDKLGMGVAGRVSYTLEGASPLINLMFNTRYYIAGSSVEVSDADIYASGNYGHLYKTERLAGLGYMVDSDIEKWNVFEENNCFERQNLFAKYATGETNNLFTIINPDVKCIDISNNEIERDEGYIEKNAYVYTFDAKYGNENDSIQIEFTVDEDMDLYVDGRNNYGGLLSVFMGEKMIATTINSYNRATYHIGNVKKGQKIVLTVVFNSQFDKDTTLSTFFRFAKFDDDVYSRVYEKLCRNVYDIETMESDYIKGRIKADEDGLMMTSVQSDIGFNVYVDGKKTECKTIGGALIGVPITKGEHVVEFKYVGVVPLYGKVISLCGIALYLLLCVIHFIKKRNQSSAIQPNYT